MSLPAEVGLPALYRDSIGTITEALDIIPQLAKLRETAAGTCDEAPCFVAGPAGMISTSKIKHFGQ